MTTTAIDGLALAPEAYEHRRFGSERAGDVARAAAEARDAFHRAHTHLYRPAFPAVDPVHGDRDAVAGALVRLPPVSPSVWVTEAVKRYLVAGDQERGRYIIEMDGDRWRKDLPASDRGADRAVEAMKRYVIATHTELRDQPWEVVAQVTGRPNLIIDGGQPVWGLDAIALAVTIGDALFVDVTRPEPRFAGEDALIPVPRPQLRDEDEPADVVRALVAAAKCEDADAWYAVFADWHAQTWSNGMAMCSPFGRPRAELSRALDDWRRGLRDDVWEIRPVATTPPRVIMRGDEVPTVTQDRVEEVEVQLELIGRRDDAFVRLPPEALRDRVRLQRRGSGPWRVVPWW
jgi:hypothetical protein